MHMVDRKIKSILIGSHYKLSQLIIPVAVWMFSYVPSYFIETVKDSSSSSKEHKPVKNVKDVTHTTNVIKPSPKTPGGNNTRIVVITIKSKQHVT